MTGFGPGAALLFLGPLIRNRVYDDPTNDLQIELGHNLTLLTTRTLKHLVESRRGIWRPFEAPSVPIVCQKSAARKLLKPLRRFTPIVPAMPCAGASAIRRPRLVSFPVSVWRVECGSRYRCREL